MLDETHRRIARQIAKELNLGKREASLLEGGSANPDSWADFPHHYGKEIEIMRNILDARRLFLQGDDECYHRLGIALHYIQDRWTLRPRLRDKHTKWEKTIEYAPILSDSELVKSIKEVLFPTRVEKAYLDFLRRIGGGVESIVEISSKDFEDLYNRLYRIDVHRIFEDQLKIQYFRGLGLKTVSFALQERPTSWSNPVLDINFSYRICLEVARKVFSREPDEEDWYDVEAERHDIEIAAREAEERRKEASMRFWMLILLAFILFITGFASANAGSPLLGLFFAIFGLLSVFLSFIYF
jgi:hypothetical protein